MSYTVQSLCVLTATTITQKTMSHYCFCIQQFVEKVLSHTKNLLSSDQTAGFTFIS